MGRGSDGEPDVRGGSYLCFFPMLVKLDGLVAFFFKVGLTMKL